MWIVLHRYGVNRRIKGKLYRTPFLIIEGMFSESNLPRINMRRYISDRVYFSIRER